MYPRISPDGTQVALDIRDEQDDIWVWNLARENLTRLTFTPGQDLYPVWSPDGQRIVYSSQQELEAPNLFWRAADGTGLAERLLEGPNEQSPTSFSPDGSTLVFTERGNGSINVVFTTGERNASPLVMAQNVTMHNADVSPDGRWVAYQSNESGRDEVYVRPYPDSESGKWIVSSGGGTRPLWSRDGRELFYFVEPGRVMAVQIEPAETFTYGNLTTVVDGNYVTGIGRTYDVAPDGQQFLMVKPATDDEGTGARLVIVQNWFEELRRLVPTN